MRLNVPMLLPVALSLILAACGRSAKSTDMATGGSAMGGSATGVGAGPSSGNAGQPPQADPSVTANYRWRECGRMGGIKPLFAVYGGEGSALVAPRAGGLLAFAPGSLLGTELVGQEQLAAVEPSGSVSNVVLSADGLTLALVLDKAVVAYRASDGLPLGAASQPLVSVPLPTNMSLRDGSITHAALSADGVRLALTSNDKLHVVDLNSGEHRTFQTSSSANGVALTASEVLVASVMSTDPKITAYSSDGETREVRLVLPSQVESATLSTDGTTLVVLLREPSTLVAIDSFTGEETWRRDAPRLGQWQGNALAANASAVVVGHGAVYSLADGTLLASLEPVWPGRVSPGAFTETSILVINEDHVSEWDLAAGTAIRHYGAVGESVRALDLSRDGRFLAAQGAGTYVWRLAADFERSQIQASPYSNSFAFNVALAPAGDALVTSGDWVTLARGLQHVQGMDPAPDVTFESTGCLSGPWAFSPDGSLVAGTDYGADVYVRDSRTFEVRQRISASNCGGGVAFSADGARLVTASLEAFETETWSRLWQVPGQAVEHTRHFRQDWVTFAQSGRELLRTRCDAESGNPCDTQRFDAESGSLLGTLPGLVGPVARYSPDEHWVVSAGRAQHVPSGATVELDPMAVVSTFDAEGNVLTGQTDGSLAKFCRY